MLVTLLAEVRAMRAQINDLGQVKNQNEGCRLFGKLMHKKGYKSIHKKSGDYYKVVEIPYEQQHMYLTLDEESETPESKSSPIRTLHIYLSPNIA